MVDEPSRWASGAGLLRHAEWDGALPADLVTPVFLFFMGSAISLSGRTLRPRTLIAAALALAIAGLGVNGLSRADPASWRVTGVLQRAGVTLALAAAANLLVSGDHRRRIALLASIAALITLSYWLIMAHVPPPGGAPGDLAAGANLAAWVDRVALGPHAWSALWDPDGILSTASSFSTVLMGLVAGIAVTSAPHRGRIALQLIGSGAGAVVGAILWTAMVPINRSLWSASFVVLSAGVAAMLLAAWSWLAPPPVATRTKARR